jgi:hypothetical protein
MIKKCLLGITATFIALVFVFTISAQPTLTEACNPYEGFSMSSINLENVAEFSQGPDQEWNLNGAVATGAADEMVFINPDELPGSYLYPDADLAALVADGEVSYFNVQSDLWEFIGNYANSSFYTTTSDPFVFMIYPTTYGSYWTSLWTGETYIDGVPNVTSVMDTIEVNGYGALTGFGGVIEDVLLVQRSSATEFLGGKGLEFHWNVQQQLWIDGLPIPLVRRTTRRIFIDGVLDETMVSVSAQDFVVRQPEIELEPISVYPNPFSNGTNVHLPISHGYSQLLIVNLLGEIVEALVLDPATTDYMILTSTTLNPGVYIGHLLGDRNSSFIVVKSE